MTDATDRLTSEVKSAFDSLQEKLDELDRCLQDNHRKIENLDRQFLLAVGVPIVACLAVIILLAGLC